MDATLNRKNREHWDQSLAVVSPAQHIDIILNLRAPAAPVPARAKPIGANKSPALKHKIMKGGRA